MSSQGEEAVFRAFAYCIFKDVQSYILEHQSEYSDWQREQEMKKNENGGNENESRDY